MAFTREVLVPVVLSEILGRIVSFLVDNFPRLSSPGALDGHRRRLERLLRHIGSVVEEAEGRCITNLHLLAQLKSLTDGMYRGRFELEVGELEGMVKNGIGDDSVVTTTGKRPLALCSSPFNAKRARSILGGGDGASVKRLATVVEELESLTRDYTREFILLVQGYPRRAVHRPVATTLNMERCVFGRHVEKERVITFLLQRTSHEAGLSALAVVGGDKVGKTTLARHVCDDERVRDHFACVEWFERWDVLRAGGRPGQTSWCSSGPEYLEGLHRILDDPRWVGPCLLVFDDACPVDERAWAALVASSALTDGSKLLFTCSKANLGRIIGTTEPVVLTSMREEEYWHYFKAFAFVGADPRDHPRIAAVGMEISRHLEGRFLEARMLGPLLRANFDVRFWRRVLAAVVKCHCLSRQGLSRNLPVDILLNLLPFSGWRLCGYTQRQRQTPPKFTVQDVLRALAASSFGSRLSGGDMTEDLTIHYYRETLYTDQWYIMTYYFRDIPEVSNFMKQQSLLYESYKKQKVDLGVCAKPFKG